MATSPIIVLTDAPEANALTVLRRGLDQYNRDACGIDDQRPIALLVKDPVTQNVLGGLNGRTSRGVLFIDVFFLPDGIRSSGLGGTLLQMAEEEGRRRGCYTGLLHTNTFQAPEFYKKHGWNEFGVFPCEPPGNQRIFMTKVLTPTS